MCECLSALCIAHVQQRQLQSQNHSQAEVGKLLWRSSCSARATQDHSRWLFNISMDGESTTSLATYASAKSPSQWKRCFLIFIDTSCVSVCAPRLMPSLGSTERNLASSSCTLLQVFKYIYKALLKPSLLWTKQSQLSRGRAFPHARAAPVTS